ITIVSFQRLLADWPMPRLPARAATCGVLSLAAVWSASEASKLITKTHLQSDTVEDSRRWSLPENVAIQRHSYGLFAVRPSYYSHGVVSPRMQSRLLDPATGKVVDSNFGLAAARKPREEFRGAIDANPGILNLNPPLTLKPGARYLLTFAFARPDTTGLLQMIGEHFYREYLLPSSG